MTATATSRLGRTDNLTVSSSVTSQSTRAPRAPLAPSSPVTKTPRRACAYVRLSEAADDSTSIARQKADLIAHAEREGYLLDERDVLVDDGISGRKDRANWDEAVRRLRDGEIDVLLVWKFDRVSRQGIRGIAALLDALDARPEALFVAIVDGLSSDSPVWRLLAVILAEVARIEADNTSKRVASSIVYRKRTGKWTGGPAPYAYTSAPSPDGVGRILVPVPEEAAAIEEAARRIVGGESLFKTAAWLSTVTRPRKTDRWSAQALTRLLRSAHLVGRVALGADVVRDDEGQPVQAFDPAIPVDLWHEVRAVLADRHEKAPNTGARKVSSRGRLLSGLVVCDDCHAPLYLRHNGQGTTTYSCSTRSNTPGSDAASVSVTADLIEAHVEAAFLRVAAALPVIRAVEVETERRDLLEAERELADVTARLDDDATPEADLDRLEAAASRLRRRVRKLRETTPDVEVRYEETGETYADVWARLGEDVAAKRETLANAVEAIYVKPGRRGGWRGIDPARVSIVWRERGEDYDAA